MNTLPQLAHRKAKKKRKREKVKDSTVDSSSSEEDDGLKEAAVSAEMFRWHFCNLDAGCDFISDENVYHPAPNKFQEDSEQWRGRSENAETGEWVKSFLQSPAR